MNAARQTHLSWLLFSSSCFVFFYSLILSSEHTRDEQENPRAKRACSRFSRCNLARACRAMYVRTRVCTSSCIAPRCHLRAYASHHVHRRLEITQLVARARYEIHVCDHVCNSLIASHGRCLEFYLEKFGCVFFFYFFFVI